MTVQGEIRPGYKQTEVGVIPEDWDCSQLDDFISFISYGFTNPMPSVRSGVYMVTAADVDSGQINYDTARYTSHEAFNKFLSPKSKPKKNDILLTKDGALGRVALVGEETICINQSVAILRPNNRVDPQFLSLLLQADPYQRRMIEDAGGSTIKHIYITIVNRMPIAVPKSKVEQRAIAAALGDADALIAALEAMIAKKRDLKQAAMQHLLTCKTRLPGFSGEWETTSFAEIVKHHAGNSFLIKGKLSPTESQGLYPCFSASGQDVWFNQFESEGDAIVVSAVGSRCGKAFRASGKWCAIANTHVVWPIRTKVVIDFLQLFLNDEDFWTKGGSGQPFVQFRQTFRRALLLPTIAEQTAIVEVLSDMDADLAALEAQAAKARAVKQGMMQELLTGRVRLV